MKRHFAIVLLLAVIFANWQLSYAQIRIGGGVGLAIENDNAKSGVSYEARLAVPLTQMIYLEGDLSYYGSETVVKYLSDDDYSLRILSACILIEARTQTFQPFSGGGIAHYQPQHELSDQLQQFLRQKGYTASEEIESKVGAMLRIGANITFSPKTQGQFSASYYRFEPKVNVTVTDINTGQSVYASDTVKLSVVALSFALFFNIR
ncbi:MAG: outer membrane beta-barrel protein [Candidatus Zixiibacteriota bacterium]